MKKKKNEKKDSKEKFTKRYSERRRGNERIYQMMDVIPRRNLITLTYVFLFLSGMSVLTLGPELGVSAESVVRLANGVCTANKSGYFLTANNTVITDPVYCFNVSVYHQFFVPGFITLSLVEFSSVNQTVFVNNTVLEDNTPYTFVIWGTNDTEPYQMMWAVDYTIFPINQSSIRLGHFADAPDADLIVFINDKPKTLLRDIPSGSFSSYVSEGNL